MLPCLMPALLIVMVTRHDDVHRLLLRGRLVRLRVLVRRRWRDEEESPEDHRRRGNHAYRRANSRAEHDNPQGVREAPSHRSWLRAPSITTRVAPSTGYIHSYPSQYPLNRGQTWYRPVMSGQAARPARTRAAEPLAPGPGDRAVSECRSPSRHGSRHLSAPKRASGSYECQPPRSRSTLLRIDLAEPHMLRRAPIEEGLRLTDSCLRSQDFFSEAVRFRHVG